MKRTSLTLAAAAVLAAPVAGAAQETCTVARIIDGDTFVCSGGTRVRLLLIDAPEMDQGDYGVHAQEKLERLLPIGGDVQLETDVHRTDCYGRLLAYVHAPTGIMANEEMVRRGFAVVSVYPPNVRYVDRFRELQAEARAERRGLWSVDAFECLPADHRRGACEPAGYAGTGSPPTRRSRSTASASICVPWERSPCLPAILASAPAPRGISRSLVTGFSVLDGPCRKGTSPPAREPRSTGGERVIELDPNTASYFRCLSTFNRDVLSKGEN